MDLEETEAKNDCAGEDHQQFNRPTEWVSCDTTGKNVSTEAENTVGIRHQVKAGEGTTDWEDLVRAVVNWSVWISDSATITCR
jgi:hypothetical protein